MKPAVRVGDVPPALHSNPITAVKWDYVWSNVMIEHNGRALAGTGTSVRHADAKQRGDKSILDVK